MLRRLLAVALLLFAFAPAHASGTVSGGSTTGTCWKFTSGGTCYQTAQAAGDAGCVSKAVAFSTTCSYAYCSGSCSSTTAQTFTYYWSPSGANYNNSIAAYGTTTYGGCPTNSTGTTTCTCNIGFQPNAGATACVTATCTGQSVATQGYFDIGTTSTGKPALIACSGDCEVFFDGSSPAGSALVGGVKHWYAEGTYYRTGSPCAGSSGPTTTQVTSTPDLPADTCAAGQVAVELNGQPVCVSQSTGAASSPTTSDTTTTETSSTVTNPDGSTTKTTTTTTTYPDGSRSITTKSETTPPGGTSPTSTSEGTQTYGPPGSQAHTGGQTGGEGTAEEDPCTANPSAAGCGGSPAAIGALRTDGTRTIGDALDDFKTGMQGTPLGGVMSSFFTVTFGTSCPTYSWALPSLMGNAVVTVDQFCASWWQDMLPFIRAAVLLGFGWLAFRIMVD